MPAPLRVLIASSETLMREGLRRILDDDPGLEVLDRGLDENGVSAALEALRPDVVVLVVDSAFGPGVEVTRDLARRHAMPKVLAVVPRNARDAMLTVLQAGAAGCVATVVAPQELVAAVHAVGRGEYYVCPMAAAALLDAYRGQDATGEGLTAREHAILLLVAQGLTNQQIAKRLHLSVRTVETYRTRTMEKLGAQNLAEMIRAAIRRHLIPA
ncbi:MAG: response regulator transcription factor [Armatimonadetes bacterium]|nr:response regulator transcription factor [Armatimonadota bacterium]